MAKKNSKKAVVEAVITTTEKQGEEIIEMTEPDLEVNQVPFVQEVEESVDEPKEEGNAATYTAISVGEVEFPKENENAETNEANSTEEAELPKKKEDKTAVKQTTISKPKRKIMKNPVLGDFTYNWNGLYVEY